MASSSSPGDDSPDASATGWGSTWWALALGVGGAALAAGIFVISLPSLPPAAPAHPLPECSAPNCSRASVSYDVPAETLFAATRRALERLDPVAAPHAPDSLRAAAVYRVGGLFKDDVTAVVAPDDGESTLHVRSKSRTGHYDFEVNRWRVRTLLDAVEQELSTSDAQPQ
ncbi:MAG: DUF1499 domain-containing protein [Salinibacter sp.]